MLDSAAFLFVPLASKPMWVWMVFIVTVLALLVLDLGVLSKGNKEISVGHSLRMSAFYVGIACLFGAWVWHSFGAQSGMEFYTGFFIEKSLSLDNIFVIAMIFSALAIPRELQHRVLFWGILGVLVLRGMMIAIGATLVTQFAWVMWFFAAFLVWTGIQMWRNVSKGEEPGNLQDSRLLRAVRWLVPMTNELHGQRFWVRQRNEATGKAVWLATPLFLALVLVELVDLLFAVDSVPAIFAITSDPFIVYTSNIFAILGLRSLYFALSAILARFHYLKYALALVLVFVGAKIVWTQMVGKPAAWVTLSVTTTLLVGGVAYSLWRTRSVRHDVAAQ